MKCCIRFCLLLVTFMLTGCSTIKSWFPDKERDYQFRTEIAPLIVPDDLKTKGAPSLTVTRTPQQMANEALVAANQEVKKVVAAQSSPVNTQSQPVVATDNKTSQPRPANDGQAVSSLTIDQSRDQAWRMVGKALNQQKIEIVVRNSTDAYYDIRYDIDATKAEYTSIWDEFLFTFGDDPNNEQLYRVLLTEMSKESTDVTVQDETGKSLSNRVANQLLKSITDGINRSNATQVPDEKNTQKTD